MGEGDILAVGGVGADLEASVVLARGLERIVELELVIGDHFGLTIILILQSTTLQTYDRVGCARGQCL